ncbi:DUF397 domain-containing protein [Actinoalloteichus fjordicus]|uniref:DUF397 domain-containing protein n=1 Tax=Actinoalloteichus fjordicus TaxID=1612552 RepID=UPI002989E517|nr:DUF397 domain-containing protein [Actinoalloteichus fjordicus]
MRSAPPCTNDEEVLIADPGRPQTNEQKSSRSGSPSDCVEIGQAPALVLIHDTKDRQSGTLRIAPVVFGDFLGLLKA